jgi:hypothetical protein
MLSVNDAYFALPDKPPVAAGLYPFRIRGSVYLRDLACYRALLPPPQFAQAMRTLPDPSYERFVAQRFDPAAWYDVLPAEYLRRAISRARGVPMHRIVRDNMAHIFQHSLAGVTGVLLKEVNADTVAAWVPRVSGAYYDFGRLEVSQAGPTRIRCMRYGIPRLVVRFWAVAISEFIESALAHCGARDPHVSFLRPEKHGEDRGYEVYRVPYDITWEGTEPSSVGAPTSISTLSSPTIPSSGRISVTVPTSVSTPSSGPISVATPASGPHPSAPSVPPVRSAPTSRPPSKR